MRPKRVALGTRPKLRPSQAAKINGTFYASGFFRFQIPLLSCLSVGIISPACGTLTRPCVAACCWCRSSFRIPEAERDPKLVEKLKAEWPAILRWVLDGCLEWQRIGLAPPAIVTEATDRYFDGETRSANGWRTIAMSRLAAI